MGFRYQRSMKLMPGIRLNFSKSGVGLSLGVPGARISISPRGRVTRRVGLPGTGMSWVSSSSGRRRSSAATGSAGRSHSAEAASPVPPSALPTPTPAPAPGLFASADERSIVRAFKAKDATTLTTVAAGGSKAAVLAAFYAALVLSDAGDDRAALHVFEPVWRNIPDIDRDGLFAKYAHHMDVTVQICDSAKVQAPGSRDTAGLLLAELLQTAGRPADALEVVRHLTWGPAAAMSAADLMCGMGDWDGVVAVTEGMPADTDEGALLWVMRARAFRLKGMLDAAKECLAPVLSSRRRDPAVRLPALLERAEISLSLGHPAAARKDVESVLAADSTSESAAALLMRLGGPRAESAVAEPPPASVD